MATLQISDSKARQLYPSADANFREVLEETFGKEFFKLSILERMKTLEDSCKELGLDIDDLFNDCADEYECAEKAIKTFAKALREGKHPSECFYYPYFQRSSGGGFSYFVFAYDLGYSLARLSGRASAWIHRKKPDTWATAC